MSSSEQSFCHIKSKTTWKLETWKLGFPVFLHQEQASRFFYMETAENASLKNSSQIL